MFKEITKRGGLNQIYSSGLRFAMLTADGTMSTQWVLCKDYLHEMIWNAIHKKPIGIYGLHLGATGPYADLENPRVAISPSNGSIVTTFLKGCEGGLRAINLFEERAGWDKSTIESAGREDVCIYRLNPKWISSPTLISLATSCMRMAWGWTGTKLEELFENPTSEVVANPYTSNDHSRLKAYFSHKWWYKIDWNSLAFTKLEDAYVPEGATQVSSLHNHTGIVSFLGKVYAGMSTKPFKLWDNIKVAA